MRPPRFWCPECVKGYSEPGTCSVHADEALHDLAVGEVRLFLEEQDDAAKQHHAKKLIGVVVALTVLVLIAVMLVVDQYDLGEYVNWVAVLFGVSAGIYAGAFALFKYKSTAPQLSTEQIAALEATLGNQDPEL